MSLSIRPLAQRFQLRHIIGARAALLAALLLVAGVAGCSAVRLGYNNAPELSYWWLDSYLNFDDAQSLKVRADLAELQERHRASELPSYVGTLAKLQLLAPTNVSAEQVCGVLTELKSHVQSLINQATPAMVALAPTLKAGQLEHLTRQFDKRNQQWRDEWLAGNPPERSARRLKQLTQRADMFYGRLQEPQLAVLRAHLGTSAFDASLTLRETLRRQQDTLQTLRQMQGGALSNPRAGAAIHALLARAMDSPDAGYQSYREKMTREHCALLAALHNSSTPEQRLKAAATLKDYETDARALMAARR